MKGQVFGQVFIYILVIIIVGLLFLFGYQGVKLIQNNACENYQLSLKHNLESSLLDNRVFGASQRDSLRAGCSYSKVCFVDTMVINNASIQLVPTDGPFVLVDSANAGVQRNVFFFDSKDIPDSRAIYFPNIQVPAPGVKCFDVKNGVFQIRFLGTGVGTRIEEW